MGMDSMNAEPNENNNNEPKEVNTRRIEENMEIAKNAQILEKLSDFEENFTSLEDLTGDTEVFEFIMKNWSTKDTHKEFIINAEMLK
jgi:K+/H+ antiporter YhaU regulatory subunit KhtT